MFADLSAVLLPEYILRGIALEGGVINSPAQNEVTELLLAWSHGQEDALQKLVPLVYKDLRQMARNYMRRERPGHTLQATALVHEAYNRLIDASNIRWRDRAHFFAVCAQLMRRALVDHARSKRFLKRGGQIRLVSLAEAAVPVQNRTEDILAIDEALTALAAIDPRKSQIVEMLFFGGLTTEETAEVLHVSPRTVLRDWKTAKVWLLRYLKDRGNSGDS
jgi:RNA polymerase sigma factor (TIGR02999 family)